MTIKPHRIFDGMADFEEIHIFPNELIGEGAETPPHTHVRTHLSIVMAEMPRWLRSFIDFLMRVDRFGWLGFGEIRCEVYKDGLWQRAAMKAFDMFEVPAGMPHRFVQTRPNGRARFACVFSRVAADGSLMREPKIEVGDAVLP